LNFEDVEPAVVGIKTLAQEKAESPGSEPQLRSSAIIQTGYDRREMTLHPAEGFFPLVTID